MKGQRYIATWKRDLMDAESARVREGLDNRLDDALPITEGEIMGLVRHNPQGAGELYSQLYVEPERLR